VAQGDEHPSLFSAGLEAHELQWVAGTQPALPLRCRSKIRYRQADHPCLIEPGPGKTVRVIFAEPQRAVTPGQSVVFYDEDVCLGGGVISHALADPAVERGSWYQRCKATA
jgi:tRNA-specific 2-thiouridylase